SYMAYKAKVDDEVMKIFEACSFQDITGQRVSKVVNVLKQIEERVGKLANTLGVDDKPVEMTPDERRKADLLLHGPAIGGPETKQDAIDAMFNDPPVVTAPFVAPAPKPAAPATPAPAAKAAPAPAPKPAPAPAPKAPQPAPTQTNSQDDIDALFDSPADLSKPASQDDIDALFD
ncbi:MAG: protein phosphatase CheZ, partial [Asticcacaulis sp.]|nr:protein phosphatase CheZ [Asticcacaulis sp.]